MKNRLTLLLFACITGTILLTSHSLVLAEENGEIQHLLAFIAQSDCTYIRNSKEYSAQEARDHIAGKYNSVKWRISNAETFIRKIASSSSFSGKEYMIRCGTKEQPTQQWLLNELARYRNQEQQL